METIKYEGLAKENWENEVKNGKHREDFISTDCYIYTELYKIEISNSFEVKEDEDVLKFELELNEGRSVTVPKTKVILLEKKRNIIKVDEYIDRITLKENTCGYCKFSNFVKLEGLALCEHPERYLKIIKSTDECCEYYELYK